MIRTSSHFFRVDFKIGRNRVSFYLGAQDQSRGRRTIGSETLNHVVCKMLSDLFRDWKPFLVCEWMGFPRESSTDSWKKYQIMIRNLI